MQKPIAIWLLICGVMVFAMVVVGGVTRLTHSGLSIVEWQPIVGTIPPLSQGDWDELLEKYQETPQYQKINKGMSLDEFKGIFWWEYFHRLLGRAIGFIFFIPFVYFLVRKKIDRPLGMKLTGIFVLGGLQGLMGWYMVMSGLVDNPHVSQYRLTAHLGLAFVIYAAILWVAMGLLSPKNHDQQDRNSLLNLRRFSIGLTSLIFIMILSGGFVAGIQAGLAYNTFPLMNGYLIPPDLFLLEPWYRNFFDNITTVQFDHRLIAWLLAILVPVFWFKARKYPFSGSARLACHFLLVMLMIQISLGIGTLLLAVPLPLAAAHQAGAMLLFTAALWMSHQLR
ncbi:cytochrome c oxidase assembly protein subunit 15 [Nitrosomonas cryotolerans]|uniref:Heme A synthase n=1 Tax=Nitrosomonas cryotolerans ATCC 49181 TaxID=1131553 RepID=A0A1N6I059_9PROT|nr:COX15/CtaA family protein [Nitrosomonas cryotolerans]SFQ09227.1 cytochrome c oxidase assembly protein subunit 15 [Nitrosomonas cryotolerans]SIO25407.1 cytochrome c oxidase assembly protein subunit 15 [Nitrosomonas cryotolerans ATCC 49181]